MRHTLLFIAIATPHWALAQTEDNDPATRHYSDIEEITVRALPFQRNRLETVQPVDMLVGETLDDRRGMTLGETLQQQPGVHSTAYGAGASRPVIRGLGGHRVLVLEDGLGTGDTSAQSDDHGVSVDPLLVDQIEILRGPATLLYGSRAAAGVVNLIDGRIPQQPVSEPLSGRFEVRGNNVADERSGVLRLDGGGGALAWHLDGSWRDADDYRIPGTARTEAEHDHEEHEGEAHDEEAAHDEISGRLFNSFVETRSGTAGLSWVTDQGHLGASIREYRSDYGIPAPHAHFEADHEDHDEADHEEEAGYDEDEYAWIDMEQRTWDISGGLNAPVSGITRAGLRVRYTDYTHEEVELEGHDHGVTPEVGGHDDGGTMFDVRNWLARLELETMPVLGGWQGAIGLQLQDQDYAAAGEEAFIPDNETRSWGLFALQERGFNELTVSTGARVERTRTRLREHPEVQAHEEHAHEEDEHGHESPGIDSRTFTTWSVSAGAIQPLNENWQVALNVQHSQRAPSETELFADGPHLATFTFEEGSPLLDKERTNSLDLKFHRHSDRFDFEANLFYNRIRDFIYLAETQEEIGGFRVREATQEDAIFHGFELQGVWQVFTSDIGHFDIRVNYDQVRGRLEQGSHLPRISPERLGASLDWHHESWRGSLDVQRVMRQDRTARFEDETPGYNMINARLAYQLNAGDRDLEVFIQGRNLGDQEARTATSFLKDFAPLPGRSVALGVRGRF